MASAREAAAAEMLDAVVARAGGPDVAAFLREYWRWTAAEDLLQRGMVDLYAAAMAHLAVGRGRPDGTTVVRAYSPTIADDGWQSTRSVLDVVTDDMPFLVDSVVMAVSALGLGVHLVVHPVLDGESWMHLEIDRLTEDGATTRLEDRVAGALAAVRAVVTDWPAMRDRALATGHELLDWLAHDHFTFLGSPGLSGPAGGDGLGLMRSSNLDVDELVTDDAVVVTKSRHESPVHRPVPLDVVRVEGAVFVGLHTSSTYRKSVFDIPLVRDTVKTVLDRAGLHRGTHAGNRLIDILETFPRDELFQVDPDWLYETAMAILHLRERAQVRLFVRPDRWGRFVSCLVYVPRDRFNTEVRLRLQDVLLETFRGIDLRFSTELGEESHARLHVVVTTTPGTPIPTDLPALEERLARVTRAWEDDLRQALVDGMGDAGHDRFESWRDAFPAAYRDEVEPVVAVEDIRRLEALGEDTIAVSLQQAPDALPHELRLRLYRHGAPLRLSEALPPLRDFGVTVLDERPYEIEPLEQPSGWIYDFGLLLPDDASTGTAARRLFEEAFLAVWRGAADSDSLGRLVLTAGLGWREVALLRTYRQYLKQAGSPFSREYIDDTLTANPTIAATLLELFHAGADGAPAVLERLEDMLSSVTSLDEDRILRAFVAVVGATIRTSWHDETRDAIAVKLDPSKVLDLPAPRPAFEIFVHAPHVEGVHLRMGRVARGGLRWSDRKEDFRTEVLGLVKAQTVKNAVIVPVGAKGGFFCRRLPVGDREQVQAEVVRCYETFVSSLLDVTDDDDPYLVVAADKGTATFSDIANAISLERGFWLGDAFASGGSTGYDHKAIGITARGAWESVRRHFRELGADADRDELTVVGIGDMSGDVFGNGMLLSPHLKLVAAFDHRHVFLDPSPDPARSFAERTRLFSLPSSSWADYDPKLISAGGGVVPRTAKSVEVTAEVATVLGIEPGVMTPTELIAAVLRAPVDLLWNGGIGTYVKASTETHDDARDRANDALRADASALRCRVIGEGGNLGLTQRARIEAARAGIHVNTDAIDNSAGVDCSDHEVNLKVLLDQVVADGDLTVKHRNELLAAMTDEVAALVLRDNFDQNLALAAARAQAPGMVDVHLRHLTWLERAVGLDRALESLPSDDELIERASAGEGLTQPELAVLLAYTKIALKTELLASDLPDDDAFAPELADYFPGAIRERYGDRLHAHPLRRELIATQVTNQVVNRAGISMVHRMEEETSASAADIVRAHVVAWQVYRLGALRTTLEQLDDVDAATQMRCILEAKKLSERATRWFIRNRRTPLDVTGTVADLAPLVTEALTAIPEAMRVLSDRPDLEEAAALRAAGVPHGLAGEIALLPVAMVALDVVDLARRREQSIEHVASTYFLVDERLGLGWLRHRITQLPRDDRWQALARSALRDDFFTEHKQLVDQVLAMDGMWRWDAENAALIERTMRVVGEIKATPSPGLAQLSVALRELRNLVHQTAVED
ncbi:MAG TPA: NAD-glutamate dehydrogenase [Acidimicrobiales bacterium]|nr:NAD-glutamate dehydrogenase [Acidimicrobiales bacterium]